MSYLHCLSCLQSVNFLDISRDPVLLTESLKVRLIPDQHDFLEFPVRKILEAGNLLTGADAAAEGRTFEGGVVGFGWDWFLLSVKHWRPPSHDNRNTLFSALIIDVIGFFDNLISLHIK